MVYSVTPISVSQSAKSLPMVVDSAVGSSAFTAFLTSDMGANEKFVNSPLHVRVKLLAS